MSDGYPTCMAAVNEGTCKMVSVIAERDQAIQRADALERAARKHKPNDGRFMCFSCSVSYKEGKCGDCGSSGKHWQLDEERY